MPKKRQRTAKQLANDERLRQAARERREQQTTPVTPPPAVSEPAPAEEQVEVSPENTNEEASVAELLRRINELESRQFFANQPAAQGPTVTAGGIRGTVVKHSLNPKDYPDPTDRLFEERVLTLQGFSRDWWDIEWSVSRVNYDTKDGIHITEPKFQVRLIRIVPDEEGMPSKRRYTLHKATFFEDPDAYIQVANDAGIEIPGTLEKAFLDEMRYLRIRDWVKESFYPAKPSQKKTNKSEAVIGNRLVEVWEANSETPEDIPFDALKKY